MDADRLRRIEDHIGRLAQRHVNWVTFATEVTEVLRPVLNFQGSCWHTVDPGTVLFTGSVNQNISCSGTWLAEHEYIQEDVNKWSFLARTGRHVGATGLATHGDLSRSARHRSQVTYGINDELRASFVTGDVYWAAAGFQRFADQPLFTEEDVRLMASLNGAIAAGLRRTLLAAVVSERSPTCVRGPGVIVFDERGRAESVSPAAEQWVAEMVEEPPPSTPGESKIVQAVAARARRLAPGQDPLQLEARSRVRTRSGAWLLLYGTPLRGNVDGRTAVIIQPGSPSEVAPLVALAYGLSDRERQVTELCLHGQSTKEMARSLKVSAYTVQDHLKSIFDKTGARTRGELVGQVFLEHYVPRWEGHADAPPGWFAKTTQ